MTKYVTNFAKEAIQHWSTFEAVREIIQNNLDSDGEATQELDGDTLVLTNKNIKLSNKVLMMGKSDKTNDTTKRGRFGTGLNFALCILTARGIEVSIQNNDVLWIPMFEYCDKFDEEVLVIEEEQLIDNCTDFIVTISGLSEDDIEDIKQTNLIFQEREILASTKYGDILKPVDECGEVFCGELFVKQTPSFSYCYNIKPEYLKLNQDRDSLSEWDLQTLTAKMIMASGNEELIKEAIDSDSKDTRHVEYSWVATAPSRVCDSYAEDFVEEHGQKLVTNDYSEHQENLDNDLPSVYIDNTVKVKSIQESSIYQEAIKDIEEVEKLSPTETLETLKENIMDILYQHLRAEKSSDVESLLDKVIEKSEDWSE